MKSGGGITQHHNLSMLKHYLSIGITSYLTKGTHLSILDLEHDLPLRTIVDAIGCFVL